MRARTWIRKTRARLGWSTRRVGRVAPCVFQYVNSGHELNWGDIVSQTVVQYLLDGTTVESTSDPLVSGKSLVVGSVMSTSMPGDIVWGAGCIRPGQVGNGGRKMHVHAVRGPLTRAQLAKNGIPCPEVYGDPALLFPEIVKDREVGPPTHRWGIVPHYTDLGHPVLENWKAEGAKIIDICAGLHEFIDQLRTVDRIASSSLHGLIAADAFGIPNTRICLGAGLVGGDFKFDDYGQSVGRTDPAGLQVSAETPLARLEGASLCDKIDIDLQRLKESAPWVY
jgi:pyruvyltransferase